MKFGSLFSGIGGMDLGLERAGMECRWQVENDAYATRVLEKHWPDVPRYGDIREVDFERVERVDLVAGGFPCQDLSYAGKGLGLSGARSGLWSEFKRCVRVVRPRFVLVENVPGLLSRGMGAVLGDLASLGYDAEWESLPAAAFGAPHLRWRVFIVAYAQRAEWRQGQSARHEPNGTDAGWPKEASGAGASSSHGGARDVADAKSSRVVGGRSAPERPGRNGPNRSSVAVADTNDAGLQERDGRIYTRGPRSAIEHSGWWSSEPNVGRVANGIPRRVDRLRGLGNAVVPQVAEYIGRQIMEAA